MKENSTEIWQCKPPLHPLTYILSTLGEMTFSSEKMRLVTKVWESIYTILLSEKFEYLYFVSAVKNVISKETLKFLKRNVSILLRFHCISKIWWFFETSFEGLLKHPLRYLHLSSNYIVFKRHSKMFMHDLNKRIKNIWYNPPLISSFFNKVSASSYISLWNLSW